MANMKAIRAHAFGGPEVLRVDEVTRPEPRSGEVLVRVRATSVNPVDWKLREGYMKDIRLPFIPGGDFSGIVEAVGGGVTEHEAGDEVYGCVPGSTGADAEFVVVPLSAVARKPRTIDHILAATIPLAGMTAYQALFDHGRLEKDVEVFILGASGGVGGFAVQLARNAGARVLGTASSAEVERVRGLGAHEVVDYERERFEERVKDVPLAIDLVGGESRQRLFQCVRRGGRLVSTVPPPPPEELARGRGITAKVFRMQPRSEQLRELARLVDEGKLRTEVAKVVSLEEVAEAEELNRRHEVTGKIGVRVAA